MARRLFLERRTYRRARLQDAARLLPILGLILFFSPIFIRAGRETDLAGGLVYYMAIWFGLIVLAALISSALARMSAEEAADASDTGDTGDIGGDPD